MALAGALATTVSVMIAQDRPLPDDETFAKGVRAHLATDEARQSGYMFLERRTQEKLDSAGQARDQTIKLFVQPDFLNSIWQIRRVIESTLSR